MKLQKELVGSRVSALSSDHIAQAMFQRIMASTNYESRVRQNTVRVDRKLLDTIIYTQLYDRTTNSWKGFKFGLVTSC